MIWEKLYANRTLHLNIVWEYIPKSLWIWKYVPDKIWSKYNSLESFFIVPFNIVSSELICFIKGHNWEYSDVIIKDNSIIKWCETCGRIKEE